MSTIIDVIVLVAFVTIIPICWYRGITYTQLHSMETLSWRILWWVIGGMMCIAVWSDIVIRLRAKPSSVWH